MDQEMWITMIPIALSSGFASAILVKILDILQEKMNQKREEKLRIEMKKDEAHDAYVLEKKEVYIETLKNCR